MQPLTASNEYQLGVQRPDGALLSIGAIGYKRTGRSTPDKQGFSP